MTTDCNLFYIIIFQVLRRDIEPVLRRIRMSFFVSLPNMKLKSLKKLLHVEFYMRN